jgi:hypothetical protein
VPTEEEARGFKRSSVVVVVVVAGAFALRSFVAGTFALRSFVVAIAVSSFPAAVFFRGQLFYLYLVVPAEEEAHAGFTWSSAPTEGQGPFLRGQPPFAPRGGAPFEHNPGARWGGLTPQGFVSAPGGGGGYPPRAGSL